jgi:Tol biopolymer transport system component
MTRLLVVATLIALAAVAPASATFPGGNGPLIVSVDDECTGGANLFSLPWRGDRLTRLTDVCDGSGEIHYVAAPEAAPDGASILAFTDSSPGGAVTMDPDGGSLTPVTLPDRVRYDDLDGVGNLSFAPAGTSFAVEAEAYLNGFDQIPLYEVFLDGSAPRTILPPAKEACDDESSCSQVTAPRWSPDGELLAVEVATPSFAPGARGSYKSGIWLIDAQTGEFIRRIAPHGFDVDWAPDGKRLAYADAVKKDSGLFVVRRDGTHRKLLVVQRHHAVSEPVWSPNGRFVAWVGSKVSGVPESPDVEPTLWSVSVRRGQKSKRRLIDLETPYVEEGYYHSPELTWLPE